MLSKFLTVSVSFFVIFFYYQVSSFNTPAFYKDSLILILFTGSFFCLLRREKFCFWYLSSLTIAMALFHSYSNDSPLFLFFFIIPLFTALYLTRIFMNSQNQTLKQLAGKKLKINKKIVSLEDKLMEKKHTLENIEKQVADIIDLFEVSKNFNECIDIEDVINLLRNQVSKILFFDKTYIILFDKEFSSKAFEKIYEIPYSGDYVEYEANTESHELKKSLKIIDLIQSTKDLVRIDFPAQLTDYFDTQMDNIVYPFWIFPLKVENRIIGIYVAEGAKVNSFTKFSIIASQLALQIEKIRLYLDVKKLSITDGLTKVFLRRHFMERLEEELRRSIKYSHKLCLLMLDIDHFKSYNDNYGHLVGDVTLKIVADVILESVRQVDLVGRYGGEEFILALPETNKEGGIDAAERIRSAVARKKLSVYDIESNITVSVGVSSFPDDISFNGKDFDPKIIDDLISCADENLYKAKEEGRNRIIYKKD